MRPIPSRIPVVLAMLAGLALAGCNRKVEDRLDDAALQAIDEQVAATLNEPGAAVLQLIKTLDKPSPIGLDAMQVVLDQQPTPIDFWLYNRGYILPIEPRADAAHPTFLITPAARQLAQGAPEWFTVAGGEPDLIDCHSPQALEAQGCVVDLTVTPVLTPAGTVAMGTPQLAPIKLHLVVAQAGADWQVRDIRVEGGSLHDYALRAMLGDDKVREAARNQMLTYLNLPTGSTPLIEVPNNLAQPNADLQFDTTPVPPELGGNPLAPPPRGGPASRPQTPAGPPSLP